MSAVDLIAALLVDLDRSVSPRPEFEAALRTRLLAELRASTSLGVARRLLWVPASANGAMNVTSGLAARRRRWTLRRRRLVLALVALALAVIITGAALAALGRNPFGGLTSWLDSSPGTPAPAAVQAGFLARNDASYAAFPRNTKLRLLLRESVGGRTFNLLGFRYRSSFCLRLVQTDKPGGIGANQCVTLRELRRAPAPALVASQAVFLIVRSGRLVGVVDGIFGFADDTARAIDLRRLRGARQSVDVADNVFVALRSTSVGKSSIASWADDPVVDVWAVTRGGRPVPVPFVGQSLPRGPSYYRSQPVDSAQLPGPTRAAVPLSSGRLDWLTKHESRGRPFTSSFLVSHSVGRVVFARSIQPDPDSPFRVGVTLTAGPERAVSGELFRGVRAYLALKPHRLTLCASEVGLLEPPGETNCTQPSAGREFFSSAHPVSVAVASTNAEHLAYEAQITRLYGVAADGVRAIDLYLASGRVIPAALRDNVYTVEAPSAQLPAKLVAYDSRHRPVWVYVPPELTPSKLTPCPAATQSSAHAAPKPYERVDLRTGAVNGHTILGRTPSQVEAALGRPDWIRPKKITSWTRGLMLVYHGRNPIDANLVVLLEKRPDKRQDQLRAVWVAYRAPNLVDKRVGNVLRVQPVELERRLEKTYGATYRHDLAYGSNPAEGCIGTFHIRQSGIEITFGIDPWFSTQSYLIIQHPYVTTN